jgi:hypothetical protein
MRRADCLAALGDAVAAAAEYVALLAQFPHDVELQRKHAACAQ